MNGEVKHWVSNWKLYELRSKDGPTAREEGRLLRLLREAESLRDLVAA